MELKVLIKGEEFNDFSKLTDETLNKLYWKIIDLKVKVANIARKREFKDLKEVTNETSK